MSGLTHLFDGSLESTSGRASRTPSVPANISTSAYTGDNDISHFSEDEYSGGGNDSRPYQCDIDELDAAIAAEESLLGARTEKLEAEEDSDLQLLLKRQDTKETEMQTRENELLDRGENERAAVRQDANSRHTSGLEQLKDVLVSRSTNRSMVAAGEINQGMAKVRELKTQRKILKDKQAKVESCPATNGGLFGGERWTSNVYPEDSTDISIDRPVETPKPKCDIRATQAKRSTKRKLPPSYPETPRNAAGKQAPGSINRQPASATRSSRRLADKQNKHDNLET